jgi:hypothetical protein
MLEKQSFFSVRRPFYRQNRNSNIPECGGEKGRLAKYSAKRQLKYSLLGMI